MLPNRSSIVPRDPRHVWVDVRTRGAVAFSALASRIMDGNIIALATFVSLEEGTPLELTIAFAAEEPFVVEAVVDLARDDEGSVLVVVTSADERARTRLARFAHEADTRPDVNVA